MSFVWVVVTVDSVPAARVSTSVERAVSAATAVRAAPVAPVPIPMYFGGAWAGVAPICRFAAIPFPTLVTTVAVPNAIGHPSFEEVFGETSFQRCSTGRGVPASSGSSRFTTSSTTFVSYPRSESSAWVS